MLAGGGPARSIRTHSQMPMPRWDVTEGPREPVPLHPYASRSCWYSARYPLGKGVPLFSVGVIVFGGSSGGIWDKFAVRFLSSLVFKGSKIRKKSLINRLSV